MDAKLQDNVCRMVEREIEIIVNKEEMSPVELEQLGELVDIIKDIHEIDIDEKGFSGRMSYGFNAMPYWGQIGYDDSQWRGRTGDNRVSFGMGRDSGTRYADGRGGNSYGRYYEDGRMMPDRNWN